MKCPSQTSIETFETARTSVPTAQMVEYLANVTDYQKNSSSQASSKVELESAPSCLKDCPDAPPLTKRDFYESKFVELLEVSILRDETERLLSGKKEYEISTKEQKKRMPRNFLGWIKDTFLPNHSQEVTKELA